MVCYGRHCDEQYNPLRSRQKSRRSGDRDVSGICVQCPVFWIENINRYHEQEERPAGLQSVRPAGHFYQLPGIVAGLVSFMVVRKAREVGIWKVLGADGVGDIVFLFHEFTLLIIIAFVLAAPAAWCFREWLAQ